MDVASLAATMTAMSGSGLAGALQTAVLRQQHQMDQALAAMLAEGAAASAANLRAAASPGTGTLVDRTA